MTRLVTTSNSIISPASANLIEVDGRDLPNADIGGTLQPGGVAAGGERPRLHEWRARHNMFAVAGGDEAREFTHRFFPVKRTGTGMKDEKEKDEGQSGKPAGDLRRERLKQALRENLKRRKSQARGRDDFPVAPSSPDDAPPRGRSEKTPGK